jgi:hypothetical protein
MTKNEVLTKLKQLAIKLHTPRLTQKEIRSVKGLEYHLRVHFRGLASALKEAGLQPTLLAEKMNTSDNELLIYILNLSKKLGKKPTVFDIRRDGKYSEVIFNKRFGRNGIQKAYESAINETKMQPVKEEKEIFLKDFPNKPLFWGRAGETYIVAELMYRGYNASLLPVDLGVDVIAIKDSKTFYFQVKNISFDKVSSRTIPITTSSFSKNQSSNMFYVFVLQRGQRKDVLFLPYQKMHELISKKLILFVSESKDFSLCIAINGNIINICLPTDRTKSEDVSNYLNDWDVIV